MIYYVTCSIYSALSLLAFRIRRSEQFNKEIFLNIALLFGIMALIELPGFWYPASSSTGLIFKTYQQILFAILSLFTITFFVLKYLVPKRNSRIHYWVAGLTTIVFCAVNFYQIFAQNPVTQPEFSLTLLRVQIFIGIFILLYAVKVYRQDSPTGEYLHLLISGFFFWFLRQAIDNFSNAFSIVYFQENKYLELLNLFFLIIILLKKLNYSISDFGRIYEQMLYNQLKLGDIRIQRRGKTNLKFLVELGCNFFQTPKSLPIIIVLVGSPGFFTISFYQALNFTVNFLGILMLFLFTVQLYQKRLNQKFILNR
jgi:hypothetical protein